MGEYATFRNGESVKLGTCESLYYIRADQMSHLAEIVKEGESDIPLSIDKAGELGYRFRFPFPDEDHIGIGDFEEHNRGLLVPRSVWAEDLVMLHRAKDAPHGSITFYAPHSPHGAALRDYKGTYWSVNQPCPNSLHTESPVKVWRQQADVEIVAQRKVEGNLATIVRCGACRSMFRLPYSDAEALAVRCRSEADRQHHNSQQDFWNTVADRILAGYED